VGELDDELAPEETGIADRLEHERPAPAAGFRGALGRHLLARDRGYGPRPENLIALVGAAVAAGAALIVLGLLQAVGAL
jgi:hypothetical protein